MGKLKLHVSYWCVIAGLLISCGFLFWRWGRLSVRSHFAQEQIEIFYNMREQSLAATPERAIEFLRYTVTYYPSGTKQDPGGDLDDAVETVRRNVILDILADLRTKTGTDYGDDPEVWIQELSKQRG